MHVLNVNVIHMSSTSCNKYFGLETNLYTSNSEKIVMCERITFSILCPYQELHQSQYYIQYISYYIFD